MLPVAHISPSEPLPSKCSWTSYLPSCKLLCMDVVEWSAEFLDSLTEWDNSRHNQQKLHRKKSFSNHLLELDRVSREIFISSWHW